MRKFKADNRVLGLIGQGKLSFQIAKETNRSPSATTQIINTLCKNGFVTREKKGNITELRLTDFGVRELSGWVANPLTHNQETYLRLHAVRNQIYFKKRTDKDLKVFVKDDTEFFKPTILVNHGSGGWLTSKDVKYFLDDSSITVILSAPSKIDIIANWRETLEKEIANLSIRSYKEALRLTSKHQIKIQSSDSRTISTNLVSVHVAIVNNNIAKRVLDKGWTKEFNRAFEKIVIIDRSLGNPELEVITPNHVFEYVEALLKLTEEFKDKDFGIYELIARLKELISGL